MTYSELEKEKEKIRKQLIEIDIEYAMNTVKDREMLYPSYIAKRNIVRNKLKKVLVQMAEIQFKEKSNNKIK